MQQKKQEKKNQKQQEPTKTEEAITQPQTHKLTHFVAMDARPSTVLSR